MQIPSGSQTITIALYSERGGRGNQLCAATAQVDIAATGFTPIPITLDGVVVKARVLIDGKASVTVPVGRPTSLPVTVSAYDAGGNLIVPPGAYTTPVVVTNSDLTGITSLGNDKPRRGSNKHHTNEAFSFSGPGVSQPLSYNGDSLVAVTLTPSIDGTPEPSTDTATLSGSGTVLKEYRLSSVPGGVSSVAGGTNGDTNVYYVTGARSAAGYSGECAIGYVSTVTGKLFENDRFFGFGQASPSGNTCESFAQSLSPPGVPADNGLFSNGYTKIAEGSNAAGSPWFWITGATNELLGIVSSSDINGPMTGQAFLNGWDNIGGDPSGEVPDPYLGVNGWWWYTFNDYPSATALGINGSFPHAGMLTLFQDANGATQFNAGPPGQEGGGGLYGGTNYDPIAIVAGTDNNLYFTDCGGFLHGSSGEIDAIGQIISGPTEGQNNFGVISEAKVPRQGSCPYALTVAADGSIWFTENPASLNPGAINSYYGHLVIDKSKFAASKITEYPLVAGADAYPTAITSTPDGSLWIAVNNYGIVRVTNLNAKVPTQDLIKPPYSGEVVRDITPGPDGNLWYANYNYDAAGGASVGRLIYGAPSTPAPQARPNHA